MASQSYTEKYKCISRIDNEEKKTFGWEVRIRRKNKQLNRFFSDSKYQNDPHKSLIAAMEARDQMVQELPKMTRIERAKVNRVNNSSGIPGVSRTKNVKQYKNKNYEYAFWQAYWCPEPGKTKSVRFSVKKYGEKGARRRAIEARESALKNLNS